MAFSTILSSTIISILILAKKSSEKSCSLLIPLFPLCLPNPFTSSTVMPDKLISCSASFTEDSLKETINNLKKAFFNSDIVLVSGGISVGDYDFVKQALKELEVKEIFYKVRQRPGKPLFFGKKDRVFIFALPGNPASTLSCFYVYVLPLINRLKGGKSDGLIRLSIPIEHDFKSVEPRALFLKATVQNKTVRILDRQHSSMLVSFAMANALVYIPQQGILLKKGSLVETLLLPNSILT